MQNVVVEWEFGTHEADLWSIRQLFPAGTTAEEFLVRLQRKTQDLLTENKRVNLHITFEGEDKRTTTLTIYAPCF